MFGVIIWSDPCASSAVIWCEEKASLAYYDAHKSEQDVPSPGFFDAGDYVEFDLVGEDRRLIAVNARTINLPSVLPHRPATAPSRGAPATQAKPHHAVDGGAEIIQLCDHRKRETQGPGYFNRRG